MWETTEERLALLELLVRGTLRRRRAQVSAYDILSEMPWTRATGRRDEIALTEKRRHDVVMLLDRVWPAWGETLVDLTASGLPPTPDGWNQLQDTRRAKSLPTLPDQLNRRTAAALTSEHSKGTLTERRLLALRGTEATHDGTVRLRPPYGVSARTRQGVVDLSFVAAVLGEVAIPERAFKEGLEFDGDIRAVLLVENLGAWRDLPNLEGWMFAHVPGWDTATVVQLLKRLPRSVPVIHFGDLDPNGVRIFLHLRERQTNLKWFIPSFWEESMEPKRMRNAWPPDLDLRDAPAFVQDLALRNLWLEQEPLVVDPRIARELETMIE